MHKNIPRSIYLTAFIIVLLLSLKQIIFWLRSGKEYKKKFDKQPQKLNLLVAWPIKTSIAFDV